MNVVVVAAAVSGVAATFAAVVLSVRLRSQVRARRAAADDAARRDELARRHTELLSSLRDRYDSDLWEMTGEDRHSLLMRVLLEASRAPAEVADVVGGAAVAEIRSMSDIAARAGRPDHVEVALGLLATEALRSPQWRRALISNYRIVIGLHLAGEAAVATSRLLARSGAGSLASFIVWRASAAQDAWEVFETLVEGWSGDLGSLTATADELAGDAAVRPPT